MAAFRSRTEMSSDHLAVGGRRAGQMLTSSIISGNAHRDHAAGMNGITMVTIDDTYIGEEGKVKEGTTAYYDMEYSMPEEDEVALEEDDDVFVIEYSNPEEDGQSYQFTMSVDRPLPPKKPVVKHPISLSGAPRPPAARPSAPRPPAPRPPAARPPASRPPAARPASQTFAHPGQPKKMKWVEDDRDVREKLLSNKSVLELGEDYDDVFKMNDGKLLVCSLCPPPGRRFKKGSGLAVHLKSMHQFEGKKTFFCTWCKQYVRTQIILDDHTKRHTNAETVFTCQVCLVKMENNSEGEGKVFRGSRWGMKRHMKSDHPGVIPPCDICRKNFKIIDSYLAHQFKHIGKTPWYCAKCQIYEMTKRGLQVHVRNHDMPKKRHVEASFLLQPGGSSLKPGGGSPPKPEGNSLKPEGSSVKPEGSSVKPEGSSLLKPEGSSPPKPEESSLKPEESSLPKPEGSSLKPEGNSLKPEGSSLKPEGSSLKLEGSSLKPEGSSPPKPEGSSPPKPEGSSLKPEGSSQKPEGSSLKSEGSSLKPEGSSLKSEGSCLKPEGSSQKPEGSSLKPEGSSLKPEGSSLKSEGSCLKPEGSSLKSEGSCLKPEGSSPPKPEGSSPPKPEGSSLKPEGSSLKPEGSSLKSEGSCLKPEGSSQKPEGSSLKPEGSSPLKPEVPAVLDNTTTEGPGV